MNSKFLIGLCLLLVSSIDAQVSPSDAVKKLNEGNKRYLSSSFKPKEYNVQRNEQKKGQHPYAIVLTCSDSRVSPEIIFDEDLGQLFVIRVAGNVIDEVTLGSIEYAAEHLHSELLVVLGHTACGAVKATLEGGDFGENINALVAKIKPAVDDAKSKIPDKEKALPLAIDNNIELQVANAIRGSNILKELIHENKFKVVGGLYNIESGAASVYDVNTKGDAGHSEEKSIKAKEKENSKKEIKHNLEKPQTSKIDSETKYVFSSDKNVKGNIWTDGERYSVQVSSWKNKSKAESTSQNLRKKAGNTFVMEFKHPDTKETWYRVRVGPFKSIQESESYSTD